MRMSERFRGMFRGARRPSERDDVDHLRRWAGAHRGVEAYVEPRTAVTETTLLLVAHDGEWTRRRINGPAAARRLARSMAIPVYDAQVLGYPRRMRTYDARRRGGDPDR